MARLKIRMDTNSDLWPPLEFALEGVFGSLRPVRSTAGAFENEHFRQVWDDISDPRQDSLEALTSEGELWLMLNLPAAATILRDLP